MFKLSEGANAIAIGHLGNNIKDPVAIIGGNCSIMAFDKLGEERLWTV